MPRTPRIKGENKVYHVIQRGNERRNLFNDDKDRKKFLEILSRMKHKYNFKIHGYCLMDNHVHIIIDIMENDISTVMKSINVSYARYFNDKYNRVGHLFQDRFQSELVEDDRYLLELSRYIHRNPVEAHMVKHPGDYRWSSYNIYIGKAEDEYHLVDPLLVLGCFSNNQATAVKEYMVYVTSTEGRKQWQKDISSSIMDIPSDNKRSVSKNEILALIRELTNQSGLKPADVLSRYTPHIEVRNKAIEVLRHNADLSFSEIGRLFGLSHSSVSKILKAQRQG
ncbi:MAG: REP-associated tyrosine transposase [Bacillota bacterium]